jgi:hypothetical protein
LLIYGFVLALARVNSAFDSFLNHMKDRSRYLLLAIINGAISFLTLATIERIRFLRLDLQYRLEQGSGGVFFDTFGWFPFWTWPILIFHVLLFPAAALIIRRYLLNRLGAGLFFWLAVAVIVTIEWLIASLTGVAVEARVRGASILEGILGAFIYRASQETALNFIFAVFAVNLVFGLVVQLAATRAQRGEPRYS